MEWQGTQSGKLSFINEPPLPDRIYKPQDQTIDEVFELERAELAPLGQAFDGYVEKAVRVRSKDVETKWLFPRHDGLKPIDIRKAWENARDKAKIQDFRFHDLRHSAASYLAMNGATLLEIAAVLGHKTLQMVKRYSHLAA